MYVRLWLLCSEHCDTSRCQEPLVCPAASQAQAIEGRRLAGCSAGTTAGAWIMWL